MCDSVKAFLSVTGLKPVQVLCGFFVESSGQNRVFSGFPVNSKQGIIRSSDEREGRGRGNAATVIAVEQAKPQLARPRLYKVIMLNDDYTPMDFVVHVLELFFGMKREQATRVMLKIHTEGRAVCGIYSRDVAETKAEQVNAYSHENEHPLLCSIEATEDESEV